MAKDFATASAQEREFTVNGVKFHYLDLSPEDVFSDVEEPSNGEGPWELSDRQILRFLPESEHQAWRDLRSSKDKPVTIKQINGVFAWLWEEATGVPLPRAELSDTGDGRTATPSSGRSRSTGATRA